MSKTKVHYLKFENGRTVNRAKQDAKALAKRQNISPIQALNQIAQQYGNFPSWEQAMQYLNCTTSPLQKTEPHQKLLCYPDLQSAFDNLENINPLSFSVKLEPYLASLVEYHYSEVDCLKNNLGNIMRCPDSVYDGWVSELHEYNKQLRLNNFSICFSDPLVAISAIDLLAFETPDAFSDKEYVEFLQKTEHDASQSSIEDFKTQLQLLSKISSYLLSNVKKRHSIVYDGLAGYRVYNPSDDERNAWNKVKNAGLHNTYFVHDNQELLLDPNSSAYIGKITVSYLHFTKQFINPSWIDLMRWVEDKTFNSFLKFSSCVLTGLDFTDKKQASLQYAKISNTENHEYLLTPTFD